MSFVLHLNDNGVYTKHDGSPLIPCQEILLADDVYTLPKHWEDEVGDVLIARQWRVPTRGGHYLVIEYLPRDRSRWPW